MGNVDFFKDEVAVHSPIFGICDNPDVNVKTPAFVDDNENNRNLWIAIVNNESGKDISFIAVDNKIKILRNDGNMENRCDGMLHNDDYIIFVELKNQRKDWIKHAVDEQLLTTINVFKENHDINIFRHRLAYACNKSQPHFHFSNKQMMQDFWNKNKVRLILDNNISLK